MEPVQGPPPRSVYALNPHPEHGFKHLRQQDSFHWPGRLYAAIMQHDDVIAVFRRQIHVMDRHESGHTHAADEFEDFELVADVEVRGTH